MFQPSSKDGLKKLKFKKHKNQILSTKKFNPHLFEKFNKNLKHRIITKYKNKAYIKRKQKSYKKNSRKKFFNNYIRIKTKYKKTEIDKKKGRGSKYSNLSFLYNFEEIKSEVVKKFRKERRLKRGSSYKEKLKERKKICLFYGNISKKEIKKIYQQALKYRGKINENLLLLMESRLDVVLYRICFFSTIFTAKQWIRHSRIKINGEIVTYSHYFLQPGDVISVQSKKILNDEINKNLQTKVEDFSNKFQNKSSLKKGIVTLYRKSKHYSFLKKLKNQLQLNLFRDKRIRHNIRKKKNFRKKLRLKRLSLKRFLFLSSLYLKKIDSFFFKKQHLFPEGGLPSKKKAKVFQTFGTKSQKSLHSEKKKRPEMMVSKSKKEIVVKKIKKKEKSNSKPNLFLKKKLTTKDFLKIRKHFILSRNYLVKKGALSVTSIKPIHIEVSYKLLTAIYLFSPQFLTFPLNLDMNLVVRSFSQG